jgi:hypothetical protein
VELTIRFLCSTHAIRRLKDRISREMLEGFESANIGIASSTYDIVGFPPLRWEGAEKPSMPTTSPTGGDAKK